MAERQLDRQAEQNHRMADLQEDVARGARELVEADARAREEIIGLQRDIQGERGEIGRQRDILEGERRDMAAKRNREPIIAETIGKTGLLLACVLSLILCWYLLHRRPEPIDDQVIAEILLEDLVAEQSLLSPPRGGLRESITSVSAETPRLSDESGRDVEPEKGG